MSFATADLNATAVEKGAAAPGDNLVRDVSLPALVIHQKALEHNIRWMQAFVSNSGAELAPHGKTSMVPALFRRQLEEGAWGITLATAVQTRAAYAHGVRRVLMANQLVGTPNMALIATCSTTRCLIFIAWSITRTTSQRWANISADAVCG